MVTTSAIAEYSDELTSAAVVVIAAVNAMHARR